ncbi:MAG: DUF3604 domain-containing protein [Pseudomonadales bacterium]
MPAPNSIARSVTANQSTDILFGDLHVHSEFSADSAVQSLPANGTEGPRSIADACDFARYCSALDFWSINDHAEALTTNKWLETQNAINDCNAVQVDPQSPDTVAFLGWEWTQRGETATRHYGHKNVLLKDSFNVPKPIAAPLAMNYVFGSMGLANSLTDRENWQSYGQYHRDLLQLLGADQCPAGVAVRDLPDDCIDVAETPQRLFEKLDDWGLSAIVIPHGMAWGKTNNKQSDFRFQLNARDHNPKWQRLLEVYSGHGNSEVYRDIDRGELLPDNTIRCPAATVGFEPCCARAEDLVKARCADPESVDCIAQVKDAQRKIFGRSPLSNAFPDIAGVTPEDFGACGQLDDAFLPAYQYLPKNSAQYAAAIRDEDGSTYRWGFIASSDNHRSRPGTGYKEFGRLHMTDGNGYFPRDEAVADDSYYYTGGLVAVHSTQRDKDSIFTALSNKQVYATSGDRIQLWFDAESKSDINEGPILYGMGSELKTRHPLTFKVRAVGAWQQEPGCPEFVEQSLTAERAAWLCRGECYNPGRQRKIIERIEVIRIRAQQPDESFNASLIEDPWKTFSCESDPNGCAVEFTDLSGTQGAEFTYYVRALQVASEAVNGNPLNCDRDERGLCIKANYCAGGANMALAEDCLAPAQERAWSSPIYVTYE